MSLIFCQEIWTTTDFRNNVDQSDLPPEVELNQCLTSAMRNHNDARSYPDQEPNG